MCKPASFIVTKENCYWSKNSDSHEVIIKENNLNDKLDPPQLVRCEVTPPNNDFSLPLDKWKFNTDQDELPIWYDVNDAEAACRRELPNWLASNVVLQHQVLANCDKYIAACLGTIQDVWGSATIQNVRGNATIQNVRDNATIQDVRGNATIQDVWGSATIQNVWDNATIQDVWGSATIQDVRGNATIQNVRGNATIQNVRCNATIQDVRGNATIQNVWDNATITITNAAIKLTPQDNVVIIDRSGDVVKVYTADKK